MNCIDKNKSIINKLKSQEFLQKDCKPLDSVTSNPMRFFLDQTNAFRRILNVIINLSNKHFTVYPSQSTIAAFSGISRQECNKYLRQMKELGIIISLYRHMNSCLYKLSSWFLDYKVRFNLDHIFWALKILPLAWLLAGKVISSQPEKTCQLEYLTQYNIKGLYKTSSTSSYRESNDKKVVMKGLKKIMENIYSQTDTKMQAIIRKLTAKLDLTKWGQIKLSGFPPEALEHALVSLEITTNLRDPFTYACKRAREYCVENNLYVDHIRITQLALKYKMPSDAKNTRGGSSFEKNQGPKQKKEQYLNDKGKHVSPKIKPWVPEVVEERDQYEEYRNAQAFIESEKGIQNARALGFHRLPNPWAAYAPDSGYTKEEAKEVKITTIQGMFGSAPLPEKTDWSNVPDEYIDEERYEPVDELF